MIQSKSGSTEKGQKRKRIKWKKDRKQAGDERGLRWRKKKIGFKKRKEGEEEKI